MKTVFLILVSALLLGAVEKNDIDIAVTKILGPKKITSYRVAKNPFAGRQRSGKESRPSRKSGFILQVDGVINKKALIDGRLYKVGDRIKGYTLRTITEKGATFMKNGRIYTAKLSNADHDIMIKRDK